VAQPWENYGKTMGKTMGKWSTHQEKCLKQKPEIVVVSVISIWFSMGFHFHGLTTGL